MRLLDLRKLNGRGGARPGHRRRGADAADAGRERTLLRPGRLGRPRVRRHVRRDGRIRLSGAGSGASGGTGREDEPGRRRRPAYVYDPGGRLNVYDPERGAGRDAAGRRATGRARSSRAGGCSCRRATRTTTRRPGSWTSTGDGRRPRRGTRHGARARSAGAARRLRGVGDAGRQRSRGPARTRVRQRPRTAYSAKCELAQDESHVPAGAEAGQARVRRSAARAEQRRADDRRRPFAPSSGFYESAAGARPAMTSPPDDRLPPRRAEREPGASPGRSRRCKGRCPPPEATGPRGPGRRWRGSPESEDLPPAAKTSNPSRKEDSCPGSSSYFSPHARWRCRRRLRRGRRRRPSGSSRCRRRRPRRCSRSAPARRSSPSTTSPTTRSRPRTRACRASRRTSRRSPATSRTSSSLLRPERARRHPARPGHPRARPERPADAGRGVRAIRQLGSVTGHAPEAGRSRRADEEADRRARRRRARGAPAG